MLIRNTTNIPDSLIVLAIKHGAKGLEGIDLDTIIIRNKPQGKIMGNWGYYYHKHNEYGRCITLNVPSNLMLPYTQHIKTRFGRLEINVADRVEFIILVMAHELRHAYQFQIKQWHKNQTVKWLETDARTWEYMALRDWRKFVEETVTLDKAARK